MDLQKETSRTGKRKLFEAELLSESSSQGSNQDEKEGLTRSLDKIVERFLERFSEKENEQFTLMDLEVTAVKRRIYDVLNVLEGNSRATKIPDVFKELDTFKRKHRKIICSSTNVSGIKSRFCVEQLERL